MSSEWRVAKIEEIAAPYSTALATGPFGSAISSKYFVDSGVPVIRGSNLSADTSTRLIDADLVFVSHEKANEFQRSVAKRGDLVFTCWGTINQVGLIDSRSKFDSYIVSNKQMKLTIDPVKADHRFIYYVFSGPAKQNEILENGIGSSVPGFNLGQLKRHEILLPPVQEQVRIADFLEAFDDRITLLRETNATLESIAQALFKSWFVDFDPVRAKAEGRQPEGMDATTAALFPDSFEESELGLVPKGWRVRAIGELVEGIYDGPHATPAESADGPVFLGIKNLTGTSLDLSDIRHISESDWTQWTRRIEPRHGDIVFSYEATLGFFALIPPGVRCCLGRRLALVRPHAENGAGMFWFHQFISAPFQQLLDKHTIHGATVNRIALKAFPSYPVLNPPEPLKSTFVDSVAPLWAAIHGNQAQAKTLTQLRDTLLPRLISGQLRLPEAEALVAEVAS
ncbi:restriction endonuclease subunit S [Pseudomonas sp. Marseille-Q0931]|uniref:restriction endonuclease subunit S n=1 Tax=Pseudomonas sp. Marseille-Q0931 TaxID=2697507 RepID=UPI0023B9EFE5|nr:restriction endonuclease subunit S [Pseudomonas sp. Marseille-Q0931]